MRKGGLQLIIADDEPIARQRLALLAEELGHRVVGQAAGAREVEAILKNTDPHALLLDIEMPGETGIELARRLYAERPGLPVVLVTAHDSFPLEAFEAGVRDYVLKPVRRERLQQALERAAMQHPATEDPASGEIIRLSMGRREERVPLERIDVFIAEGGYVMARSTQREGFVDARLRDLEDRLEPYLLRVHRNCLAVKASVKGLETHGPADHRLVFHDDLEPVAVSRRQLPRVREFLRHGV